MVSATASGSSPMGEDHLRRGDLLAHRDLDDALGRTSMVASALAAGRCSVSPARARSRDQGQGKIVVAIDIEQTQSGREALVARGPFAPGKGLVGQKAPVRS